MKKSTFSFLSADKGTKIHAVKWEPDTGKLEGILQIAHGMVEYIERYEAFAEYMTKKGFLVVGHDHLGHGASVVSPEYWGYFAPKNGSDVLVEDMNTLRTMTQKEYPELPYFMAGHSMGSFLLRKYLSKYGENLQGAILLGTGNKPDKLVKQGKIICRFLAFFRGWSYRSKLVNNLAFSGNNSRFESEGDNAWLTKDKDIRASYSSQECCNFIFTLNGFYNLFDTIYDMNRPEHINAIPKELPVFLAAGEDDPVGNYGAGVKEVYAAYEKAGIEDVTYKLYPTDRHEILNEIDREKVFEDIYAWIKVHIELG